MAIDFSLSPELEAIRLRVRTFVNDIITPVEEQIEGKDGGEGLHGRERIGALIELRKVAKKD